MKSQKKYVHTISAKISEETKILLSAMKYTEDMRWAGMSRSAIIRHLIEEGALKSLVQS